MSKTLFHGISILIILFLTLGFNKLNLYDYANYAGPINDFLNGLPLLTFRANYGFMPIIFLGQIFKTIPLNARNLHFVIAITNSGGFVVYYLFLCRIFRDTRWAMLATIFAIFVKHLTGNGATYQIPQQTFIRMGMWLFVAYALSFRRLLLSMLLVGINVFWSLDFGIYTFIAYCMYLFVESLNTDVLTFLKNLTRHLFQLFLTITSVFIFINGLYFIYYRSLPQWTLHYLSALNVQSTSSMVPVPNVPILWVYVLLFVITISFLIAKKSEKKTFGSSQSAVLFTACVGLVTFNYFLGRSYINSIPVLSLPLFVCVFYLFKVFFDQNINKFVAIVIIATLLAVPGTLWAYQGIQNLAWAHPLNTIRVLNNTAPEALDEYYWVGSTANGIAAKYPDEIRENRLTLLSIWDTWILVIHKTPNRAGINCLICYYPEEDLSFVADNIIKSPSKFLFVDSDRQLEHSRVERIFVKIANRYRYLETIGFLDVYTRI